MKLNDCLPRIAKALTLTPRVLLLGQHYLGPDASRNPLFAAIGSALGGPPDLYRWWLGCEEPVTSRATRLRDIDDNVIVPDDVVGLLSLPWSAVFTSAIDATLRRTLQIPNRRTVHQIFRAAGRTDSASVPMFRLFGSVDREDADELPPGDKGDALRRRRLSAINILNNISEIVAAGSLFVDGWQPSTDWLRVRDLAQSMAAFAEGQVFLFGAEDAVLQELEGDDDFKDRIDSGVVLPVRARLSEVVTRLRELGQLPLADERESDQNFVFYKVAKVRPPDFSPPGEDKLATVAFPRLQWRRLSDGKTILTDLEPTRPLPDSKTGTQDAFRTFAQGEINWSWVRHLAFSRAILGTLFDECVKAVRTPNPEEHTIVLYGQSGSGKSVLLALLALELRRMGLPVIFAGPSILPVSREHLDMFCAAIAADSSAPVIFINDAARDDTEYTDLSAYLVSRARACVVVGSSYPSQRVEGQDHSAASRVVTRRSRGAPGALHAVSLPINLSGDEADALLAHLQRFLPYEHDSRSILKRILGQDIANFFAFIYRLLPESRRRGRAGIIAEYTESARKMAERLDEFARDLPGAQDTAVGIALKDVVAKGVSESIEEDIVARAKGRSSTEVSEALRLINAVMVVSQLGLQVPQSLALRLIDHSITAYRGSVEGDVIEVREVQQGIYTLQARHALEAEIWISERLNDLDGQFALVRQLVKQLRGSEMCEDHAPELEFAVQVLRTLGPQGPERLRRPVLYTRIAGLVAELRSLHRDVHPRLLLVESNAIREAIKQKQGFGGDISLEERRKVLHEWVKELEAAEEGLRIAQEMVVARSPGGSLSQGARRMLATLATERASVVGFMIGSLHRVLPPGEREKPEWTSRADQWLSNARASWRESIRYDDGNFRSIDTACWILDERYRLGGLSNKQKADLFAEWAEMIDRYAECDLTPPQLDHRDAREAQLANLKGDMKRLVAVEKRAAERGSNAVHVLRARWLAQGKGARVGREYIEQNCSATRFATANPQVDPTTDRPVLLLYCRLWWQDETGFGRYLEDERMCLKFSRQRWEELRRLLQTRLSLEGEEEHPPSLFLMGCSLAHLGRMSEAETVFDHLDRLGVGGVRRSRALMLLTDESGNPRQLTAEFQGRRRAERFLAWCDDLRTNIPFSPVELTGTPDIRPGRQVGPFHVSFRFRGLYAEPVSRYADTERRRLPAQAP